MVPAGPFADGSGDEVVIALHLRCQGSLEASEHMVELQIRTLQVSDVVEAPRSIAVRIDDRELCLHQLQYFLSLV